MVDCGWSHYGDPSPWIQCCYVLHTGLSPRSEMCLTWVLPVRTISPHQKNMRVGKYESKLLPTVVWRAVYPSFTTIINIQTIDASVFGSCSKFSNAQKTSRSLQCQTGHLCDRRTEKVLESCKSLGQTCRCQPLEWKRQALCPAYQHMVSVRYTLENPTAFGR